MSSQSNSGSESARRDARGRSEGSKRDWADARAKVEREGKCRLSDHPLHVCDGPLEAAHTVRRKYDTRVQAHRLDYLWVNPDSVVPLCPAAHREYDAYRLDLLPFLTLDEQADAVRRVGIVRALARLTGGAKVGGGS